MPAVERRPAPPFELVLINERAEIERAHSELDLYLADLSLEPRAAASTRLVIEELLMNAIAYAFPQGGRHLISVSVALETEDVVVRIEDEGQPFDPFARELTAPAHRLVDATIGGRGLRLVRSVTRALSYQRDGGRNMIEVRIPRRPQPNLPVT